MDGVTVTPISTTELRVSWPPMAGAELYRVFRDSAFIKDLPGDISSYVDSGLTPGRNYKYMVNAILSGSGTTLLEGSGGGGSGSGAGKIYRLRGESVQCNDLLDNGQRSLIITGDSSTGIQKFVANFFGPLGQNAVELPTGVVVFGARGAWQGSRLGVLSLSTNVGLVFYDLLIGPGDDIMLRSEPYRFGDKYTRSGPVLITESGVVLSSYQALPGPKPASAVTYRFDFLSSSSAQWAEPLLVTIASTGGDIPSSWMCAIEHPSSKNILCGITRDSLHTLALVMIEPVNGRLQLLDVEPRYLPDEDEAGYDRARDGEFPKPTMTRDGVDAYLVCQNFHRYPMLSGTGWNTGTRMLSVVLPNGDTIQRALHDRGSVPYRRYLPEYNGPIEREDQFSVCVRDGKLTILHGKWPHMTELVLSQLTPAGWTDPVKVATLLGEHLLDPVSYQVPAAGWWELAAGRPQIVVWRFA